jgi:hypothetical protein
MPGRQLAVQDDAFSQKFPKISQLQMRKTSQDNHPVEQVDSTRNKATILHHVNAQWQSKDAQ